MADIVLYVLFVAVSVIKFQEKGIQRFVERRVSRFIQLKIKIEVERVTFLKSRDQFACKADLPADVLYTKLALTLSVALQWSILNQFWAILNQLNHNEPTEHTEWSILNQFWILLNGYFEII